MKTAKSQREFARARALFPGGVNSPVRAFRAVGGEPRFIARGEGAHLVDVDGNHLVDYVLSWGPLLAGHAHPDIVKAITDAAAHGTCFGAPSPRESDLAEKVRALVPSMKRMRLVSSGTEATSAALRVARGFTGRERIVKFEGSSHRAADSLVVRAGSGVETRGLPDSPGVPAALAKLTTVLPCNDVEAVRGFFRSPQGRETACAIVEPVVGNMGVLLPRAGFLETLREETRAAGSLLVFDEVMTGFRVARGGAQQRYGIEPDLTCLGKVIGGGLPVGAYGGRDEILARVAPEGPMYQAGTLSGNPLAMAAGCAMLKQLRDRKDDIYPKIDKLSGVLVDGVMAAARDAGVSLCANRVGSMFTWFFQKGPVTDWDSASKSNTEAFGKFFHAVLDAGVYLPPSQYEAAFLGATHSEEDVQRTIAAAKQAFAGLRG